MVWSVVGAPGMDDVRTGDFGFRDMLQLAATRSNDKDPIGGWWGWVGGSGAMLEPCEVSVVSV